MAIFVMAALVVTAVWLAFGKGSIPSAVRARVSFGEATLADQIDSAVGRLNKAIQDLENEITKARESLLAIKAQVIRAQSLVEKKEEEVRRYNKAAEAFAAQNNRDDAGRALTAASNAESELKDLKNRSRQLQESETKIQAAVNTLISRGNDLRAKKNDIRSRGVTAQVVLDVNTMVSNLDTSVGKGDVARADELIQDLESRATASEQVAGQYGTDDLEAKIDRLSINNGDTEAELNALMAKYQPAAATAEGRLSSKTDK